MDYNDEIFYQQTPNGFLFKTSYLWDDFDPNNVKDKVNAMRERVLSHVKIIGADYRYDEAYDSCRSVWTASISVDVPDSEFEFENGDGDTHYETELTLFALEFSILKHNMIDTTSCLPEILKRPF
ncbi:hypothetical protein [Burkholderia gladioli]|uniref:hypothetical protein n=1 Tax=Burkholderia gladioli TaxID=28095 RepID=UPI001640204F|nr:hypothetical protein [Burkholderia gladioli]